MVVALSPTTAGCSIKPSLRVQASKAEQNSGMSIICTKIRLILVGSVVELWIIKLEVVQSIVSRLITNNMSSCGNAAALTPTDDTGASLEVVVRNLSTRT